MNFLPTGLKESAKWSLSFRVLWLEPLILFYSVHIYILYVPAILFFVFKSKSVICVYVYLFYVLCYVAVNPHKYTRIEGETWKYGYFNPW